MWEGAVKISVKDALLDSLCLYRKKFVPLLGVSFLIVLISLIEKAGMRLLVYVRNFSAHSILLWMAVALLLFVNIAFEPKVQMAAMNIINAFLNGENVSFKEAYHKTKGKYFIMLLFTVMLESLSQLGNLAEAYLIRLDISVWTSMSLNYFYYICISTVFFALIPMIAIEPKTNHYIKKSTMLIKGNIPAIFILVAIVTVGISAINLWLPGFIWSVVLQRRYYSPMWDQIHFATFTIINFIAFPLCYAVKVSAYRRLTVKEEEAAMV